MQVDISTDTNFNSLPIVTSSYGSYKTYNINEAFHVIDSYVASSTTTVDAYKRLRYQLTGNFNITGSADVALPLTQHGGDAFPLSSIDYINVSVVIKENGSWFNDITSINITSSGGQIHVFIDAPALNETNEFRIIAVNENPDDFVI